MLPESHPPRREISSLTAAASGINSHSWSQSQHTFLKVIFCTSSHCQAVLCSPLPPGSTRDDVPCTITDSHWVYRHSPHWAITLPAGDLAREESPGKESPSQPGQGLRPVNRERTPDSLKGWGRQDHTLCALIDFSSLRADSSGGDSDSFCKALQSKTA